MDPTALRAIERDVRAELDSLATRRTEMVTAGATAQQLEDLENDIAAARIKLHYTREAIAELAA